MKYKDLIEKYDTRYHKVLIHALNWLDVTEPKWQLKTTVDREEFCDSIVERAAV